MKIRSALVATIVVVVSMGLGAHDFWLAVSDWHVAPGSRVTVTANVGDRFPNPTSFTAPERVESLRLIGPAGETDVTPRFRREGDSLAADVRLPSTPGTYVIAMTIKPRFIEIKPPEFAKYLQHEGLEAVISERANRGETDRPGRERYSRYAKVVVMAGNRDAGHVIRPLGLTAELVPLSDPTSLRVGDTLVVRLLAQGQPVAGALLGGIYAASKGAPDDWPLKGRTDANGEVRFGLTHGGPWLFRSVHMVRASDPGSPAADWASYWASLAFELGRE
jgi:uncharacterized GH25 family protein